MTLWAGVGGMRAQLLKITSKKTHMKNFGGPKTLGGGGTHPPLVYNVGMEVAVV